MTAPSSPEEREALVARLAAAMADWVGHAVANARKDAESQLGTLDRALRMRVERRMKECDSGTVAPSDPSAILAGIRHFGLASDGADLRDLDAAIAKQAAERAALQARVAELEASTVRLMAANAGWQENMQNAWAALGMVREAVEMFGPSTSLDGPDAVLLRGPEPVHEAEAITEALARLRLELSDLYGSLADTRDEAHGSEVGDITGADGARRRAAALLKAAPAPTVARPMGGACGECHLQPGETCDICGAYAPPTIRALPINDEEGM